MAEEICECIDRKMVETVEQMMPCFEDVILKNVEGLKEESGVQSITEIDTEAMGNKVGAILVKTCDRAITIFGNAGQTSETIVEKQEDISCGDLKNGEFYYLTNRLDGQIADTTFVTISGDLFLERMQMGRYYSLLNINWKSDCEYDLIFVESNDPLKKELSTPGEVYKYEIIRIEDRTIYVKVYWKNEEFQVPLYKID